MRCRSRERHARRVAPVGRGCVAAALLACAAAACAGDAPVRPDETPAALRAEALRAGLAPMPSTPPYPIDNPYDASRVELGHLLFFDPVLSGPRDVACSTCHLPRFAFGDGRQFPVGAGATGLGPDRSLPDPPPLRPMSRNAPTIMNVGLFGHLAPEPSVNGTMFWGADAFGLEDQVLGPISNDNELRGLVYSKIDARDSVLARLRAIPAYVQRFATAYPSLVGTGASSPDQLITTMTLRRALAAYIRQLVTPHAPIDAFLAGDDAALTAPQQRGLALFIGKANCVACHRGPLLSDFTPHVIGVAQMGIGRDSTPGDDIGWGEHGGPPYSFRTSPLRQVALTAPYFHDGAAATLEDVLHFKNDGVSRYDRVTPSMLDPAVHPLGLTEPEMTDLLAFLHALTDSVSMRDSLFLAPPAVPSGLQVPR